MNKSYTSIRVWAVGFMVSLCLLLAGVAQAATMLGDVTSPADAVIPSSGNSPATNGAALAIDNNNNTKYVNLDKFNTGFTVTPTNGGTRITGLTLTTANDCQECDPASYEIYGGNTPTGPFSLLFTGNIASISNRLNKRIFTNAIPASAIYTSYKIIFPTTARSGWTNAMQVAEVELPGSVETVDTWAPYIVRASAPNLTTIKLEFSEPVNIDNGASFTVSGDAACASGDRAFAPTFGENSSIVLLTTELPMVPGNTYTVTAVAVEDLTPNVAGTLTATAFATTGVSAMGISIDFAGRDPGVVVSNQTDEAGYVLRKYWNGINNNYWYGGANQSITNATGILTDGNGQPTPVTLRFECNGWWSDGASPYLTPTEVMMHGMMKPESGNATRGQIGAWIFTNLPAGKYDVVTYMANDCTNSWGDMWAVNFEGGVTNYFISQNKFAPPWTEVSNTTDPNNRTRGNFAILHNLSPVDSKLPIWLQYPMAGGEPWSAHSGGPSFSGMQLIPAPGMKSIHGGGNMLQEIVLKFVDPLNDSVASAGNFVVSGDINVYSALLSEDKKVLTLTTDPMVAGKTYYVTMNNIVSEDSSATWPENAMASFVAYGPTDISINFSGQGASGTPSRLNASDIAGVGTDARLNWNNVDGRMVIDDLYGPFVRTNAWGVECEQLPKAATVMWPLKDVDGAPSPVNITYIANTNYGNFLNSTGVNVGDKKMMLGALQYRPGSTVSNIWIENVPNGIYKVIVYTIQTNNANGEEIITLNGNSLHVMSQGSSDWDANLPAAFVKGVDASTLCNYVVFDGVLPDNNTFKFDITAVGAVASISGIQILSTETIPVQFTKIPVDAKVIENQDFTFTSGVYGPGAKTIQWYMCDIGDASGTPIIGANSFTYTAKATGNLDQKQFYVVVNNGLEGQEAISPRATLSVARDITAPRLVNFVGGPPAPNKFALMFNEVLDAASAQNVNNYTFTGGSTAIAVTTASLETNANAQVAVLLTLDSPLQANTTYQLAIGAVKDISYAGNTVSSNLTFRTLGVIWTNNMVEDRWFNFNTGGNVNNMMANALYPNSPGSITNRGSFDHPGIQNNDGARLVSHIIPPQTGVYVFQTISDDQSVILLSTDQDPAHKVEIARETSWSSETSSGKISGSIFLVKDVAYYLEADYANGSGGSYIHVRAKKPSDSSYSPISTTNGWGVRFCVTNDTSAPFITGVSASPVANQVTVNFNKPMNDSVVSTAAGSFATVTNATTAFAVTNMTLLSNKTTVLLSLDANLTAGTTYTVTMGGAGVNDATWNTNHMSPDPSSGQIVGYATVPANPVLKETWIGLDLTTYTANGVTALVNNVRYPCSPDTAAFVNTFDLTQPGFIYDIPHDGGRLRTWLVPAVSGNYQFQMLADDSAELYLSGSANPAEKKQILYQNAYTTTWSTSPVLNLQAGTAYYLEVLYQNNTGYDFVHVKWKTPGATNYTDIPASQMVYAINPVGVGITINSQPVSKTVEECRAVTFSVGASVTCGAGVPLYQWYKNGTAIPGGTNATVSIVPTIADTLSPIHCQVYLPGVTPVNSDPATLTVTADTDLPAPVTVKGDASLTNIVITFSEDLDQASALAVGNYKVVDSQGVNLGLNEGNPATVTLVKPNVVVLGFYGQKMVQGERYDVTFANIWDACHINTIPDGLRRQFRAWKLMPYAATFEVYTNVPGATVGDLTGTLKYQNNRPDETYYLGTFDSREVFTADMDTVPSSHDDYGARIYAWFRAPASGTYRFYAMGDEKMEFYISTDMDPANKGSAVLTNGSAVSAFSEASYLATNKDLLAGQFYYIEGIYKETTWADFMRVGVKMVSDSATLTNMLQPIGPEYLWTMMDPDSFPTLPTTGMKAVGELTVRGFNNHIMQVTNTFTNSTIEVAEAVLNGTYGPDMLNTASMPFFAETNIINYSLNPSIRSGRIFPDVLFPGATNNFVMETKTYVHLKPGLYAFGVNSDDDFRLYGGFTSSSTNLGQFNNPAGASGLARTNSSTVIRLNVTQEGLYPMRLVYLQNNATANLEWWNADTNGVDLGINAAGAPEAYRPTDANAPTITSYPTNGLTVDCGVALNFPVTALDPEDGPIAVVCNPASGSKFTVGNTPVTCNATDAFGNAAAPCSFTVTCTHTNPPAFNYPTNGMNVQCAGAVDLGVTVTDSCDGALTPVCTPASGSAFPAGVTTVTCTATDSANNTKEVSFTVTVADTTGPVFTGIAAQPITVECAAVTGAPVTYTLPTATDACDGPATVTCLPASGSTFAVGDTTVTCEAFDTHNNRGTATFTVRVTDAAPVVTDGATNRMVCSSVPTVVNFEVHAIDTCGTATVTCNPASGSTFNTGVTTVSCTATDEHRNTTAPFTFTVTVKSDRPTLTLTQDATSVTVTWTKSECYKLYTRTDLGTQSKASDLAWDAYTGTVTDNGTTCTAVITKAAQGNMFFMLK